MAQVAEEIVVASYGTINVAPYGTALPADNAAPTSSLNAAFVELGFASEDGVTFTSGRTVEERMAWQALTAVRRDVTGIENTFATNLLQWNEDTVRTAFGGGEVENVALNVFRYTPPAAGDALEEVSVVINWRDGDKNYRLIVEKATIDGDTEVTLNRADMAMLPLSFKALTAEGESPWVIVSDDEAFIGAGS